MVQAAPHKIEIKPKTQILLTVISVVITDFLFGQNEPLKSADE